MAKSNNSNSIYKPKFTFIPAYTLGISSNNVNVKLKGRMIGHLEAKDVPKFENGNVGVFKPVDDYLNFYSLKLMDYLKLITPAKKMSRKKASYSLCDHEWINEREFCSVIFRECDKCGTLHATGINDAEIKDNS